MKIIKLFKKIVNESEEVKSEEVLKRVQFLHFNQYVSSELKSYQVISYEAFRLWAIERQPMLIKQIGLEVYDLWKEIRGIIKGMIPKEWIRYEINVLDFPYEAQNRFCGSPPAACRTAKHREA